MTGKSHIAFGVSAFIGMCGIDMAINGHCTMTYPEMAVGLGACVIGSLAPDIDHPQSKISNSDVALGLLSKGVCTLTSHRQHTHTLLFCFLGGLGAYLLSLFTIGRANSSTAFMLALMTFILLQIDETTRLRKFASIIAVAVYFGLPFVIPLIPVDIPTITIPTSFAKYIGIFFCVGCLSHVAIADCACKEGCPLTWPITPMKKHFRFGHITTGTLAETITTTIVSVVFVGFAGLLYTMGYFKLPF